MTSHMTALPTQPPPQAPPPHPLSPPQVVTWTLTTLPPLSLPPALPPPSPQIATLTVTSPLYRTPPPSPLPLACAFIEYGHQRGIVVHGTHQALVADNVLSDVRGAGIYVEDGNELSNRFLYNVVICPWSREGPLKSCTVPGTDNDQADTSLNHAGLWAHASDNHFVGNRFANSFNGLFIQGDFEGGNGRGAVQSQLCTEHERFGRVSGNTNHGHGRFGTYILGPHFPRNVQQTLAMNGVMNLSTCAAFDSSGIDTGVPVRISDNLDWGNVFVGQYDVGDVQYHHHTSIDNLNLLCIHAEA
jgi:hypothetical protein